MLTWKMKKKIVRRNDERDEQTGDRNQRAVRLY